MGAEGFKRKITAIMSADVVGYSKLMGDDEAATVQTLAVYKDVMTSLITQHRGRVIDSPGDNMLSEFASVVDAVQCAVAIQKELKSRNGELPENRKMKFRIGINLGDVIEEKDRIYGDGVNIAARLESIADPGGICVSKTAFDHIETKLPLGYEFLGKQEVKNIAKPVGAYRVLMEPRVIGIGKPTKKHTVSVKRTTVIILFATIFILFFAIGIWQFYRNSKTIEAATEERMVFPLPDKPSIAVLPFVDLSNDPELEYLSDGFTDTLISALSKMPGMFVIARTSTFTYKGKSIPINQIAEELGVQYVIEGSFQKSKENLRVTVQMIDALKGYHMWSKRYDKTVEDIFKIQDEITLNILKLIGVKYDKVIAGNLSVAGTNNLDAYLLSLEAIKYFLDLTPDSYKESKRLTKKAMELDPNYLNPYIGLSSIYAREARYGFSNSAEKSREQALLIAQKAVEIDKSSAEAHNVLARAYYELKQFDESISEYKKAIDLDPNNGGGYNIGWALCYAGRAEEAIPYFEMMMRVSPKSSFPLLGLGDTKLFQGEYEDAIPYLQKAIEMNPKYFRMHLDLAACYAALGREKEAKAAAEQVLKASPNFSIDKYINRGLPVKNIEDIKPYVDALRKIPFPVT